jgi:competence protein ComEC
MLLRDVRDTQPARRPQSLRIAPALLLIALGAFAAPAPKALEVDTVDVEGGKALLIISPSGESMVIDVGWAKSDTRAASTDVIINAAKAAGLKQIDYLVISHYDADHLGDVPALAARFPIRHLVDHGALTTSGKGVEQRYRPYAALYGKINHLAVRAGDKIPIKGLEVQVVTSAGNVIDKPVPGGGMANPSCASVQREPAIASDAEDNMSIGLLFTFGTFRMIDLADLEAHNDYDLVCPANRIGRVDVYIVNVHGQFKGMTPVLLEAMRPRVAIMGNGASKGGDAETWPVLRGSPGLEDIWQSHFSIAGGRDKNPPEDFIGNLNPKDASNSSPELDRHESIKLSAQSDGTFTVTNSRNGFSKTYQPRSLAAAIPMQQDATSGRTSAMTLSNDKLKLTLAPTGGRFTDLVLLQGESLSPFGSTGHFLALDGFGAPSPEEQAAGIPFHGEAGKQPVQVVSHRDSGPVRSLTTQMSLPLAQETLTRTFEMADGENVVYVTNELESQIGVDRPVSWAEHAMITPPFLEKGKVVVDMPALYCRVRPFKPGPIPGHLVYERDFKWPMAPTIEGGHADLRLIPTDRNALDLASCQMDPQRTFAFVTALHLEKRLLYGYLFRREEYPWVMSWMYYTGDEKAARGMEFSTQPFDISHRETVAMNPLFGTPTFRWLPAKSKIRTRFLLFYTTVPEGFSRVDDVTLQGDKLTIEDWSSGKRVVLPASLGL